MLETISVIELRDYKKKYWKIKIYFNLRILTYTDTTNYKALFQETAHYTLMSC
mgnify:CR=1 FL=1